MGTGTHTTRFIIQVGDGADPENFGFTCGADAYDVSFTNNLGENVVLDCDSPLDVPASIIRHLESQDTSANISGLIALESLDMWRAWADTGTEKNIRLFMDESGANGGGHWELPAYLAGFQIEKQSSSKVTFSASISGAGQRVWTAAA